MKNIIQLYFENQKRVPFVVRRESWTDAFGLAVISVRPKKSGKGWYGAVLGYGLKPLDGTPSNEYWGTASDPIEVHCAGCYQWVIVDTIPSEWLSSMQNQSV